MKRRYGKLSTALIGVLWGLTSLFHFTNPDGRTFAAEQAGEDHIRQGTALETNAAELPTRGSVAVPDTAVAQAPDSAASDPFAFGDFTWLNGNDRRHSSVLDSKMFTGSFMVDVNYNYSFNRPIDHTNVGSTATFR